MSNLELIDFHGKNRKADLFQTSLCTKGKIPKSTNSLINKYRRNNLKHTGITSGKKSLIYPSFNQTNLNLKIKKKIYLLVVTANVHTDNSGIAPLKPDGTLVTHTVEKSRHFKQPITNDTNLDISRQTVLTLKYHKLLNISRINASSKRQST